MRVLSSWAAVALCWIGGRAYSCSGSWVPAVLWQCVCGFWAKEAPSAVGLWVLSEGGSVDGGSWAKGGSIGGGSWAKETPSAVGLWVLGDDSLVRWWRAKNKARGRLKERKMLRVRERERERERDRKMGVERVQDIASLSKDEIPAEFIRSVSEQPGITTVRGEVLEVPTIDLADPDEEKVLRAIVDASRKWGMFQIVNHEIPVEAISKLQAVGKEFFELPPEEKEVYAKPPGPQSVEGYGTKLQKEVEGKKAWVDHLFHRIWPPSAINYNFWPKNPPSYREANEEYAKYLHGVVEKLLKSLSLGLGLEGHELKEAASGDDMVYLLKINYYPPCPRPDLALGVPAHTDMSAITILVPNHVQGLQACRDGQWYDVKYIPNALVIHIGDQLEILSNGKYKSVLHRTTVNKEHTRMSWPVFLEPPQDFEVGPHPKLVNHENPPKYKTKKYGDYVYCKLNKIPQ